MTIFTREAAREFANRVGTTADTQPRSGYLLSDLQPIIDGKMPLPNFKPLELDHAVGNIAACYAPGIRGNALIPGNPHYAWAQFFLDRGQRGGLQGSGVVLYWSAGKGKAGAFAICVHEQVEGAGANHSRGWHPATCAKCGRDLSVDSGD